ncbi:MAG TPA: Hsp20/alpha crystallin family protein [Gammaproteobacteria bacterium]|nr:Hsp20/alpha crystallin family protein [Gammaproteobacteria bacterium]
MNQLTQSLNHTWESLNSGWHHLTQRASEALTRFHPAKDARSQDKMPSNVSHWGLMSADVFDDNDKVIVKLEAPGMSKDDFDIRVDDNVLYIKGEKHFEHEETKGHYQILERAYGHFQRAIPLGYEVDADQARATYKKGVLTLTLNKLPHQRRRQITVN